MNKAVPNKNQIIRKLKQHKADLEKFGVKRIGLFGSFVRGKPNPKSDIDLLLDIKEATERVTAIGTLCGLR